MEAAVVIASAGAPLTSTLGFSVHLLQFRKHTRPLQEAVEDPERVLQGLVVAFVPPLVACLQGEDGSPALLPRLVVKPGDAGDLRRQT